MALDGVDLDVAPGGGAGRGGRDRLRQDRDGPGGDAPAAPDRAARRPGALRFEGQRPAGARRAGDATPARGRHGDRSSRTRPPPSTRCSPSGAQMRDVLAAHDRERGDAATARIREVLAAVGMPDVERVMRALPAPAVGRHAPARDDRDGAAVPAAAAHRRRAHDRAGRDHRGPDPGSCCGASSWRRASASCSSPTTWAWCGACATGWRCCTRAASWRRPGTTACSRHPSIPTREGCSRPCRAQRRGAATLASDPAARCQLTLAPSQVAPSRRAAHSRSIAVPASGRS